jgi:hypothetical protein
MRGDRNSSVMQRAVALNSNEHAIRWRDSKTGRYRRDIWFISTSHALQISSLPAAHRRAAKSSAFEN